MKRLCLILIFAASVTFANAQSVQSPAANKPSKMKSKKEMNRSMEINKTMIPAHELQKAITENIIKDFPKYKVLEAYRLSNDNSAAYEILVKKGNHKENLYFTKDGQFVRKEMTWGKPMSRMMSKKNVRNSKN